MLRGFKIKPWYWLMICVIIALFTPDFRLMRVTSFSMEPVFSDGDYVLVRPIGYEAHGLRFMKTQVRRGDVIICRAPYNESRFLIKRVIAIGGDRIRISEGKLLIDDVVQSESYAHYSNPTSVFWPMGWKLQQNHDVIVLPQHYFVMGDNRDASFDSRHWGFLPEGDVVHIVSVRIGHLELHRRQRELPHSALQNSTELLP